MHGGTFFLDPNGRNSPLAELTATLAAFAMPVLSNSDEHARCRFPARWMWLKARLGAEIEFQGQIRCPAFDGWTHSSTVSSISMVLATGYLGNPASYYGHTLLKLNFKDEPKHTRLMDVSVNYGAIVINNDDPVTYILKSLTGGYDGGFSHTNYYFHNHNYGELELRDLWEYRLNLPQPAVNLVVAHAWEIMGKRFTYGFFRENCAYQMAKVLEAVDGLEITPKKWPWIIPQALVQEFFFVKYKGNSVLAEVTYWPSRQSRFYEKFNHLTPQEIRILRESVERRDAFDVLSQEDLPRSSRQAILDALIDYYQVIGNPLESADPAIKESYANALAARYSLEPGPVVEIKQQPASPHLARPPGWIQAGFLSHSDSGEMISLRIRPAYYDQLDGDSGHVPNASLTMGELQINSRPGRTYINKLEIIGIDSVNPGLTRLPGDDGGAWKIHVGAEQARLRCDDCLVVRAQGDVGFGRQWDRGVFGAAYFGGALQNSRSGQGAGFGRVSADLVLKPSDAFGAKFNFEWRQPFSSAAAPYGVFGSEARWVLSKNIDLRGTYERDASNVFGVAVGFYW